MIPASEFVKEFASDRRHMRRADGTWIKPPPSYPAIKTASKCNYSLVMTHIKHVPIFFLLNQNPIVCICKSELILDSTYNLEEYIQMDHTKGPGEVLNLTQFVQRFYKPPT